MSTSQGYLNEYSIWLIDDFKETKFKVQHVVSMVLKALLQKILKQNMFNTYE